MNQAKRPVIVDEEIELDGYFYNHAVGFFLVQKRRYL